MEWRKVSKADSLKEWVLEKTGKTVEALLEIKPQYKINRFNEVKALLDEARTKGTVVTLVADYDDDGVQSALIMSVLMKLYGLSFELIMPKRFSEGYGLSEKIMERVAGNHLLITIDNGIRAIESIRIAKEKGMKVVVLDHHQAGDVLPEADVIIDPEAVGEADYTHYCGAGLAYKLATYLLGETNPYCPALAAFAAIGTIGDCVELTGDNRKIVMDGMAAMKSGNVMPALQLFMEKCKFSDSTSAMDVAFNIVPALNAPGRLYDDGARISVSALFGNPNPEKIETLLKINDMRKKYVSEVMEKLDLDAMAHSKERAIFLYQEDLHPGIVGIVAGNITEKVKRPAFVFAKDAQTGLLKGSVRSSSDDYSIIQVMEQANEHLEKYGGHAKAAAASLKEENLEAFKNAVCSLLPEAQYEEYLPYDLEVPGGEFLDVAEEILSLEPCGEGNAAPIVRTKVRLNPDKNGNTFRYMGTDNAHVKFYGDGFDIVAFYSAEQLKDKPMPKFLDVVGRVTVNIYKERRSIQVIAEAFQAL